MDKTRVAIVGTGFGSFVHLPALRRAGFDVQALVGRDPERTRKRAEILGVPRGCATLAEALAPGDVQAVVVATPPHTHAPLVFEALRAGCHVVCEKPLARDAAEARELLAAAEAAGGVHLMGHEFRFEPDHALLRRVIRRGDIGEPRAATFVMNAPAFAHPDVSVPDWWRDSSHAGGWLQGFAIHVADQIRNTLGDFAGVSAALTVPDWPGWSVELAYHVRFRLQNGVEGVMQSNAADLGPPLVVNRIVGTEGSAWTQDGGVMIADRKGVRAVDLPPELASLVAAEPPPDPVPAELVTNDYDRTHASGIGVVPYTRLYRQFGARIRGELPEEGAAQAASFADGAAGMAVLDAIRSSARDDRWVEVGKA